MLMMVMTQLQSKKQRKHLKAQKPMTHDDSDQTGKRQKVKQKQREKMNRTSPMMAKSRNERRMMRSQAKPQGQET